MTCVLFPMSCVCCTATNKLAAVCLLAFTVPHFRRCFLVTGRKIQKWKEPIVWLVKWQISYRRRNAPPRITLALRPNSGLGHLVVGVSRSYTDTISGRTPLHGWSALRRGRYLQNTQQTQEKTSVPSPRFELTIPQRDSNRRSPAGFEPTIPAIKRPQTCALDRAATGMSGRKFTSRKLSSFVCLIMPSPLVKQQTPYSSFLTASRVAEFVSKELPFGILVCC